MNFIHVATVNGKEMVINSSFISHIMPSLNGETCTVVMMTHDHFTLAVPLEELMEMIVNGDDDDDDDDDDDNKNTKNEND